MPAPASSWICRSRELSCADAPLIMGIVNVTPDSFYDGGQHNTVAAATAHALSLITDGADLLDIGGESTRPGSQAVSVEEELGRVIPVVEAIRRQSDIPLSIDTTKAAVAHAALERGADIINDVSALESDPAMAGVVRHFAAGVALMHMRGTPGTMQQNPEYGDVVTEVCDYLGGRIRALAALGLDETRFAIDPGIGFGKTAAHNVSLIRNLQRLAGLGRPILVGVSRKSFIGATLDRRVDERLAGSLGAMLACVENGAGIVRVHDVRETRDAVRITRLLKGGKD